MRPIDADAAIEAVCEEVMDRFFVPPSVGYDVAEEALKKLPSAQPESTRTFVELVVKYPDPELCTYKEYKGKPYYSIKYIENGETYIGYGTYNPKVLSQYLKEYFLLSAHPERPPYVSEIESEYKKWVSMPHINKPLAKAMYEVWKKHDREDVSRNG